MSLDDPAPRVPKRRSGFRSFSPGATPRQREVFHVKRAGVVQKPSKRDRRRGTPMVSISREMVIGVLLLGMLVLVARVVFC